MKSTKTYEAGDKMISLIADNYDVLQSLQAFGVSLGFGDKTVREICEQNNVDTTTFLAVVNLTINGTVSADVNSLSAETLLRYLEACHHYYLEFQLPSVRDELAGCIGADENVGRLILKVYDDYAREITRHMQSEERTLFPYVQKLLQGEVSPTYCIDDFAKHHPQADQSLRELKQLIIKYLPPDKNNSMRLTSALCHIYNNAEWLANHRMVEDSMFVPLIRGIEDKLKVEKVNTALQAFANAEDNVQGETLSDREKEVIVQVVQGKSNKEIADSLCISVHTVVTHRKNIARKLQVHSPAGLTVYAIVNGLVDLSGVK